MGEGEVRTQGWGMVSKMRCQTQLGRRVFSQPRSTQAGGYFFRSQSQKDLEKLNRISTPLLPHPPEPHRRGLLDGSQAHSLCLKLISSVLTSS